MPKHTISELKSVLRYEPETGQFTWLPRANSKRFLHANCIAGGKDPEGYHCIHYQGCFYRAHRIAWLFVYGEWPNGEIDHINCIRDDNRIVNLRVATRSQNKGNTRRLVNNKTGFKGVVPVKSGTKMKYRSQIKKNDVTTYLGWFDSPEEAHAAYKRAAVETFQEFANDGMGG